MIFENYNQPVVAEQRYRSVTHQNIYSWGSQDHPNLRKKVTIKTI
ncbi:hypothetical protein GMMP15_1610003 [Candidatus Magnetomoraceae bacterium gMMP-15]